MFNMNLEFKDFYDTRVRLGADLRRELAKKRDLNLERLKSGLDLLSAANGRKYPHFKSFQNQGGYAMHTLNQDPEGANGYDIDVAIIFSGDDLPESPLAARQRVRDALLQKCGNFADVPEARTNAVTIWYSEGYHIDFAIYRLRLGQDGRQIIEHASTEWKERQPSAITEWFNQRVDALSPKANPTTGFFPKVDPGQFRRIVRFVKWFCRSRTGWSLPGGMIVSTLLAEVYRPNADRDDRSLYDTLKALQIRTAKNDVFNPVDGSKLTSKTEIESQIKRLHENLKTHTPRLDILFDQSACDRHKARAAWDWIFNNPYWADKENLNVRKSFNESSNSVLPNQVQIRCDLSRKPRGKPFAQYKSGSTLLPKGIHLTFSIEWTNIPLPYDVEWFVQNEGDEAADDKQLSWRKSDQKAMTSTKYKGVHRMTCLIKRNGQIIATASHVVRIAPGSMRLLR